MSPITLFFLFSMAQAQLRFDSPGKGAPTTWHFESPVKITEGHSRTKDWAFEGEMGTPGLQPPVALSKAASLCVRLKVDADGEALRLEIGSYAEKEFKPHPDAAAERVCIVRATHRAPCSATGPASCRIKPFSMVLPAAEPGAAPKGWGLTAPLGPVTLEFQKPVVSFKSPSS